MAPTVLPRRNRSGLHGFQTRSNRKQLTDKRTSDGSRCESPGSAYLPSPGPLRRRSADMSTCPSLSDQIFHEPDMQPKVFALCDVTIMAHPLAFAVVLYL